MNVNQPELIESMRRLLSQNRYEEVLQQVARAVHRLTFHPQVWGHYLYVSEFDALVHEVGARILENAGIAEAEPKENRRNIFVVTEMFPDGGHSRVVEDLVTLLPDYENIVIATDLFCSYAAKRVGPGVSGERLSQANAKVLFLSNDSLVRKVANLMKLISDFSPENVFLLAHYEDVITFAATNPLLGARCYFVHHAEHSVSLGASVKTYIHLDARPAIHQHCSHHLGRPSIFCPLSVADKGRKTFGEVRREYCSTISCGGWRHFSCVPSSVTYLDAVVPILRHIGGQHFHVGAIPDAALATMRRILADQGIAPERFRYIGWVPSVGDTFRATDAHIYVDSVPWGGGLAVVEAMSAGLPILRSELPDVPHLLHVDVGYPQAASWTNLNELVSGLDVLIANHSMHGQNSRGHFERYYTQKRLRDHLMRLIA